MGELAPWAGGGFGGSGGMFAFGISPGEGGLMSGAGGFDGRGGNSFGGPGGGGGGDGGMGGFMPGATVACGPAKPSFLSGGGGASCGVSGVFDSV
jgi:hypothetical protein